MASEAIHQPRNHVHVFDSGQVKFDAGRRRRFVHRPGVPHGKGDILAESERKPCVQRDGVVRLHLDVVC